MGLVGGMVFDWMLVINNLAWLYVITTIEVETMFDACGFIILHEQFSQDHALMNFAQGVPTHAM
jgi:hypothetical protein